MPSRSRFLLLLSSLLLLSASSHFSLAQSVLERSPCVSDGRVNTPYCPHTPGTLESPLPNANYTIGDEITLAWNKDWPIFASSGSVDVYVCPQSSPSNCITIGKGLQTSFEKVAWRTNSSLSPGEYYVVVVGLNSTPQVSSDQRGPSFFLRASPTASPTSQATLIVTQTSDSILKPSDDMSDPKNNLPVIVITSVVGGLLFLALVLTGFLFYRRRKNSQSSLPFSQKPSHLSSITPDANTNYEQAKLSPSSNNSGTKSNSNMISNTEAIIIANSFKLALKKPIGDSDDEDEDLTTMISNMGMQPTPASEKEHIDFTPSSIQIPPLPSMNSSQARPNPPTDSYFPPVEEDKRSNHSSKSEPATPVSTPASTPGTAGVGRGEGGTPHSSQSLDRPSALTVKQVSMEEIQSPMELDERLLKNVKSNPCIVVESDSSTTSKPSDQNETTNVHRKSTMVVKEGTSEHRDQQ
ncbi:hypothetical protein BKA69DRAFT_1125610 [Paraphysoderma sedebokerense]|nr:hypothetical protein BKA69DRAFT_1125610 [Paraphysoderma sedebokerense]